MNDPLEFDRLDEMASAYVDGEAAGAEAAEIERALANGDSNLETRITELRVVAAKVATEPPAPSAALKAAQIDKAMASFAGASELSASEAEVIDLRPRAASSQRWLMSAAAALVVVGGLGFAITRYSGEPSEFADAGASDDATVSASNASSLEGNATSQNDSDASAEDDAAFSADAADTEAEDAMEETAETTVGADETQAEDEADGAVPPVDDPAGLPLLLNQGDAIDQVLAAAAPFGIGLPLAESKCSNSISRALAEKSAAPEQFDLTSATGWFPVQLGDTAGELFVFSAADGTPLGVVLGDSDCGLLLE